MALLGPVVGTGTRERLDELVEVDPKLGVSRLVWLRTPAVSAAPKQVLAQLDKLAYVQELGAGRWDLACLAANQVARLAALGRRLPAQAVARMGEERRLAVLVCFSVHALGRLTDEILDLFDLALGATERKARRQLEEWRITNAASTDRKLRLLVSLGRILLDPSTSADAKLAEVAADIGIERLCDGDRRGSRAAPPRRRRHGRLARHPTAPAPPVHPDNVGPHHLLLPRRRRALLGALELIKTTPRRAKLPKGAPVGFIGRSWLPYVQHDDGLDRRFYEWPRRGSCAALFAPARCGRRPVGGTTTPRRSSSRPPNGPPCAATPWRSPAPRRRPWSAWTPPGPSSPTPPPSSTPPWADGSCVRLKDGRVVISPITAQPEDQRADELGPDRRPPPRIRPHRCVDRGGRLGRLHRYVRRRRASDPRGRRTISYTSTPRSWPRRATSA